MNSESKITLSETERNILKELYEDGMNYTNKLENEKQKLLNTYVSIYYEGNKQEVDISNKIICHWIDEFEDYELWVSLCNSPLFEKYLQNKAGLLELIKSSKIKLFKRTYDNYNEILFIKELDYEMLNDYVVFTKDSTLGYDFYETILD